MAGELQTHQRTVTNVDRPRTEHVWLGSRNHQLRRHLKKKLALEQGSRQRILNSRCKDGFAFCKDHSLPCENRLQGGQRERGCSSLYNNSHSLGFCILTVQLLGHTKEAHGSLL